MGGIFVQSELGSSSLSATSHGMQSIFLKKTSYRFLYQLISVIGLMGECDTCDKCYALLILLLLDSIIFKEDYISLYTYRDDSSWLHCFIYFRFRDYLMHFFFHLFFLEIVYFFLQICHKLHYTS